MTIKTKAFLGATFSLFLLTLFSLWIGTVSANPSYFQRQKTSDTATTTLAHLTGGTATTTLTFDTGASASTAVDEAVLLINLTASSTNTTLNWEYEYSQDGATWYKDNVSTATTSIIFVLQTPSSFSWVYASTTVGGIGVSSTTNTGAKTVLVPTPTRYVRVIFSLAAGGTNGALFAEIVGKRQSN